MPIHSWLGEGAVISIKANRIIESAHPKRKYGTHYDLTVMSDVQVLRCLYTGTKVTKLLVSHIDFPNIALSCKAGNITVTTAAEPEKRWGHVVSIVKSCARHFACCSR
jgi:hypothetical protein